MKQYPSRLNYKKYHKPNKSFLNLREQKVFFPSNGFYALKAMETGKLTFKQIESGRRTIRRTTKKLGNISIKVFPYASITKKPVSSRMGKGKGAHSFWMCPIRRGQLIYELAGVSYNVSFKAMVQAGSKMPFKTKVVRLTY